MSAALSEKPRALEGAKEKPRAGKETSGARDPQHLTTTKVAEMLGVSSPNTVKNWLEGGHFPGAFKTLGGHWRFPVDEVLAMQERLRELTEKNRAGDMTPPEHSDDDEWPLL